VNIAPSVLNLPNVTNAVVAIRLKSFHFLDYFLDGYTFECGFSLMKFWTAQLRQMAGTGYWIPLIRNLGYHRRVCLHCTNPEGYFAICVGSLFSGHSTIALDIVV
jgi:hypothetical protein